MTKKDYVQLAGAFQRSKPLIEDIEEPIFATWILCVQEVADVLERDNSKFDRRRFLETCGIGKTRA